MLVIDASAVGAMMLDDEQSPPAAVLETLATSNLTAPAHWPTEVANLILMAERRQRIAERHRRYLFDRIGELRVAIRRDDERAIWEGGVMLAIEHRLTIYDAAYLELAVRLGHGLVTLDTDLLAAARARGVPLLTWPAS